MIAFAGKVGQGIDELYDLGIKSVVGIVPGVVTLEEALDISHRSSNFITN